MTKETLDYELLVLAKKYESDCIELKKKYADANNPYKLGDTIQDHIGKGIIEKIGYTFGYRIACRYFCLELKKDGTPRKDKSRRWFYQLNLNKN